MFIPFAARYRRPPRPISLAGSRPNADPFASIFGYTASPSASHEQLNGAETTSINTVPGRDHLEYSLSTAAGSELSSIPTAAEDLEGLRHRTMVSTKHASKGVRRLLDLAKLIAGRAGLQAGVIYSQIQQKLFGALPWKRWHSDLTIRTQLLLLFMGTPMAMCINLLFLAAPVGFVLYYAGGRQTASFFINLLAIIPNARVLGWAIDDINIEGRAGNSVGTVINNTFRSVATSLRSCEPSLTSYLSNAVQLISAMLLLKARLVDLVHFALMGSIFSNLLLMTGLSFLIGGIKPRRRQFFNANIAQMMAMFLLLATLSLVIPTASGELTAITDAQVEAQSLGTATVVLFSYCLWLYFQLGPDRHLISQLSQTHDPQKGITTYASDTISSASEDVDPGRVTSDDNRDRSSVIVHPVTGTERVDYLDLLARMHARLPETAATTGGLQECSRCEQLRTTCLTHGPSFPSVLSVVRRLLRDERHTQAVMRLCTLGSAVGGCYASQEIGFTQEHVLVEALHAWTNFNGRFRRVTRTCHALCRHHRSTDQPLMDISVAIVTILVSTALVGLHTEYATNSIQGLLQRASLSRYFVGLVLLPLLSCEPAAIVYAKADRLDLSISLTLDRCMQTAMMVIPLMVLLAAALGIDLTLQFDAFTIITVFVSIVILSYVVQEGQSNW